MSAVIKQDSSLAPVTQDSALMAIIARAASDPQMDVAKLTQLLELQERWAATQARKEFVAAMAAFKAAPPRLMKNKQVSFGNTNYKHATLDEVSEKIGAALALHGLSHRWNVAQVENRITVTCTLTHTAGHSESTTLSATADTSGQKNAIQAIGSAVSYLERYTLLAATGLSTSEATDDDGKGAGAAVCITETQAAEIEALLVKVPHKRDSFMRYYKVEKLADIKAASYQTIIAELNKAAAPRKAS